MNRIKRGALIVAGSAAVVMGGIGVAVPILPTTPFIIAAGLCFSASSPRMYGWLVRSRYFGEYIENYRTGAGVSARTKAFSLIFLWSLLLISGFMMRSDPLAPVILPVVGAAVTAHILMLRRRSAPVGCDALSEKQ